MSPPAEIWSRTSRRTASLSIRSIHVALSQMPCSPAEEKPGRIWAAAKEVTESMPPGSAFLFLPPARKFLNSIVLARMNDSTWTSFPSFTSSCCVNQTVSLSRLSLPSLQLTLSSLSLPRTIAVRLAPSSLWLLSGCDGGDGGDHQFGFFRIAHAKTRRSGAKERERERDQKGPRSLARFPLDSVRIYFLPLD